MIKNWKIKLKRTFLKCFSTQKQTIPTFNLQPKMQKNIEKETKKEDGNCIKTVIKFKKIGTAALEQKKSEHTDELFDDLAGDNVPILDDRLKTEDVFIDENYLFDSSDEQETENICEYVLNDIDQNDVPLEDLSKPEFVARDRRLEKLSGK